MHMHSESVARAEQGTFALDLPSDFVPGENRQIGQFQVVCFSRSHSLAPKWRSLMGMLEQVSKLRLLPILARLSLSGFDRYNVDDRRQKRFWLRIAECHRLFAERPVLQWQL